MARNSAKARVFEPVDVPDPEVARARLEGSLRAVYEHCVKHLGHARSSLDNASRNNFESFEKELEAVEASMELARRFHAEWKKITAELKR